jgi:hypothetical protein
MTFHKRSAVVQVTSNICKCGNPAMSHAYLPMLEGNVGRCLSKGCKCVGFKQATLGEIAAMGLNKKPDEE